MKPVSVQLYSLREQAKNDFVAVLRKVAEIGYKGVEPAGLFGHSPQEVRRIVEDLGMVVSSNHGPWPTAENLQEVVDVACGLGSRLVVSGFGPEEFKSADAVRQTADKINLATGKLNEAGLDLALHNHWWEFMCLEDGRLAYEHLMELCPGLKCEIDVYWASNFGLVDPAEQVARYKDRTPLLHIKDGPLVKDMPHVAVGQGKMDIPAVVRAADPGVLQWLVVELDHCATDMTQAVADSYLYLTRNGLGEGNK